MVKPTDGRENFVIMDTAQTLQCIIERICNTDQ